MATFNNDTAKKKWASLQNKAGVSLQKIAAGNASSADRQNVASTLSSLNSLATSVFEDAVDSAAKEAQAVVDKINAKREGSGKKPLSTGQLQNLYETATSQALSTKWPSLLADIKDAITLELYEQDDRTEKTLGSHFTDLQTLLPPKDLPTTDDLLAAQELQLESWERIDSANWEKREASLVDKVIEGFKATIMAVAAQRRGDTGGGSGVGNGQLRLAGPSGTGSSGNQLARVAGLVGGGMGGRSSSSGDVIDMEHSGGSSTSPTIQLSRTTEEAITTAASAQTNLFAQIRSLLGSGGSSGSSGGSTTQGDESESRDDEEKEEKKADTWWRSFRNWIGSDDKDKKKKHDDDDEGGGWLGKIRKMLGVVLPLLGAVIADPQLFISLAEKVKELLTWDNIKDAATASWQFIADKGGGLVDWVLAKFGIDKPKVSDNVQNLKDNGGATLTKGATDESHDSTKAAALAKIDQDLHNYKGPKSAYPTSTPGGGNTGSWQSKLGSMLGMSFGSDDTTGPREAPVMTSPSSGPSVPPVSTTTTNRSSLNINPSSSTNNTSNSTMSVSGTNPSMGKPTTTAGPSASNSGNSSAKSAPAVGTQQVGISSFGFHSGVDDSLAIANMGFLGM